MANFGLEVRKYEAIMWALQSDDVKPEGCPEMCLSYQTAPDEDKVPDGGQYCWKIGLCARKFAATKNAAMKPIQSRAKRGRCIRCGKGVAQLAGLYCWKCAAADTGVQGQLGRLDKLER